MYCEVHFLVLTAIFSRYRLFMPDNAAFEIAGRAEVEPVHPTIRIDNQPFISAVDQVVPEEAADIVASQLVLS